ncbi:probable G-protein coupled receptor 158 isoform X2 [Daktulosphaira vitifoliae]|uniref:probable G-protein coupled receptor 158 isoform X2 n=1 Tax=Daktulosphaira vitifoliae TaxID=58002 RepID=UPI0021AA68BF|nr:probable G-protein coupled receptor 158 isoform X2 [Daktulosphaira vitifoliae]
MLRIWLLCAQLFITALTFILILVVFSKRKCKTIATSMWTLLETIIIGTIILHLEVVVQYFEPSIVTCLLLPWLREIGFVICYGAINLKLYRILMQFRTRKAHCWTVRDKDLLRYLSSAIVAVIVYLAAWTAASLNFFSEGFHLVVINVTNDGYKFKTCKPQWWNYITETGELMVLLVGIHYGLSARNAHVLFDERRYLFYAIVSETVFSSIYYTFRSLYPTALFFPDLLFMAAVIRGLLTNTFTLFVIFMPKIWFQKQVNAENKRSALNQELLETLKPDVAEVDLTEISISDMNPNEIREELRRIYGQMEMLKMKSICQRNPHISKRRGGKKLPHRRFSLQSSIRSRRKLKNRDSFENSETNEITEVSRSPEDSVGSNEEGPVSGSGGSGRCECSTATGIHQSGCLEHSDNPASNIHQVILAKFNKTVWLIAFVLKNITASTGYRMAASSCSRNIIITKCYLVEHN